MTELAWTNSVSFSLIAAVLRVPVSHRDAERTKCTGDKGLVHVSAVDVGAADRGAVVAIARVSDRPEDILFVDRKERRIAVQARDEVLV